MVIMAGLSKCHYALTPFVYPIFLIPFVHLFFVPKLFVKAIILFTGDTDF